MSTNSIATRYSVRELQEMKNNGNARPLDSLVMAWKGIKELPYTDKNSFFMLGGYHGEPFEGPHQTEPTYWGGYCNHANVLFPTWHRIYVRKIELALQTIVPGVMLPYWDETSTSSIQKGIPAVLTDEKYTYASGEVIDNPLRSFVFPIDVDDPTTGSNNMYTKPAGYETVRYPLSGLVGTEEARAITAAHNAQFPKYAEQQFYLNNNIRNWLRGSDNSGNDIVTEFEDCLEAPNYTAFSNTQSAGAWNKQNAGKVVVALESPHNDIHLAVGGFDIPGQGNFDNIPGANGDMGENNTAGLDPIFFFHHCNVDRMFWLWQIKTGNTESLEIIDGFPGATNAYNNGRGQGPAVGQGDDENLKLTTPLIPFQQENGNYYTSNDVINIETQLGVTYSDGSLATSRITKLKTMAFTKKLQVSGINREQIRGSFLILAYADVNGKEIFLGRHSVLSRWNVANCENCQNSLDVEAFFNLSDKLSDEEIEQAHFRVEIKGRPQGDNKLRIAKQSNFDIKVVD